MSHTPARPATTAVLLGLTSGGEGAQAPPGLGTPEPWSALSPILGRSPFQRHLRHLSKLGVDRFLIPVDGTTDAEALQRVCEQQAARVMKTPHELVFVRGEWDTDGDEAVVMVETGRVIDPRIYEAVFSAAVFSTATLPEARAVWVGDDATGDGLEPQVVGLRIAASASTSLSGPSEEMLSVGDMDPYIPNLRRTLRPYWTPTVEATDRGRAADMLLDATQKGVLDFPARFLHPPPENFLVRVFSPTPITPNQITIFTGIIGFWATWLFAMQAYTPAILIALLVNVLDGVDGKLARVKLLASRFGDKLDHVLDLLFEFSWYLGIGWGLSGGGVSGTPFRMGVGLIGIMLGARAMSGVYKWVSGRQIHDHRAFDRALRLVAGRRNIYVMILVGGLLLGRFPGAFTLCFAWGVATLLIYSVRTAVEATGWLGGEAGQRA